MVRRKTVYVIGAGFSKGCGYPLTSSLLVDVWCRIDEADRTRLKKIIEFHHPYFDESKNETFPGIEVLLTELKVNIDLFSSSRPNVGNFKKEELIEAQSSLLNEVATWFHELFTDGIYTPWLESFAKRVKAENAGIITFNWDLLLEKKLFDSRPTAEEYGLGNTLPKTGPVILKPHGSLNWYEGGQLDPVKEAKRDILFTSQDGNQNVQIFYPPRQVKSSSGKRYSPLLVPPTYLKDFQREIFQRLWQNCTDLLSTASKVVFLGYSIPKDDLQARFILRCGFHNQKEGRLGKNGKRLNPTGPAEVLVVNPDEHVVQEIRKVAGPSIDVSWPTKTVEEWVGIEKRKSSKS